MKLDFYLPLPGGLTGGSPFGGSPGATGGFPGFIGAGDESHASPIRSPSVSFWSELAIVGQLSFESATLSLSLSVRESHASPIPSLSVSFWSELAIVGQL